MAMTYDFSAITTGQTDADSPVNQMLMDSIRQNIYHLREALYGVTGTYTADKEHDHDGTNSAYIAGVDTETITPSMLKDGFPFTVIDFIDQTDGDAAVLSTNVTDWSFSRDYDTYIPTGADELRAKFELKVSSDTYEGRARLAIGAAKATTVTRQNTAYGWTSACVLDVSALNGAQTLSIELEVENAAIYVYCRAVAIYFFHA